MPIRFSLPSVRELWPHPHIDWREIDVQRSCGHSDRLSFPMTRGLFDALAVERRQLCLECRGLFTRVRDNAARPVFRIVTAHGVWGVERKLYDATGAAAFRVIRFARSRDECVQWIAAHFAQLPYRIERPSYGAAAAE